MEIKKLGRFRLATISKLTSVDPFKFTNMPTTYGLALETQTTDENHYYVIAFIKWNEKEATTDMETVGERFLNEVNTNADWAIVRLLLKYAVKLITDMNNLED